MKLLDLRAPPETAWLTVKQLAAWFQVSERQVERMIEQGLPYLEAGGSHSRRYLVRDVLAWATGRSRRGQVPQPGRAA